MLFPIWKILEETGITDHLTCLLRNLYAGVEATFCNPLDCSTSDSSVYGTLQARILAAAAKSLQSCPTLCDPIDGLLPGSPIPGILQARTLEWVAISFSNA